VKYLGFDTTKSTLDTFSQEEEEDGEEKSIAYTHTKRHKK
jgi:hypothetical protein